MVLPIRPVRLMALLTLALALTLLLTPTASVIAQSEDVWLVEYYGNINLEGPILYTETLPGPYLDKEWPYGEGPRQGGVPDDGFSARFTTTHTFYGGNIKFMLNSDDGSRLYLDDELIIDEWHDRAADFYTARVLTVPAGTYTIRVEFFDRDLFNSVEARFEPTTDEPSADDTNWVPGGGSSAVPEDTGSGGAAPAANEWVAEYFGNMDLEEPVLYTESLPGPYLEKEWPYGEGPRRGGVPDDMWSARFTTLHTFYGGNVKFMLNSDDGSRMYINGYLVIDQWKDRAATWYESRVLPIPAGTYVITVEYYDHFGANSVEARFEPTADEPSADDQDFVLPDWALPGQGGGVPSGGTDEPGSGGGVPPSSPTPAPAGETVVIDDDDKAFTWSGSDEWGFGFGGLLNNLYLYTGNSATELKMWGRWNPYISTTGYWNVYVYVPLHANATTNARYRVFHAGVLSPVVAVNQNAAADSWVWLGSFWFTKGASQYLYLNDLTYEPENSREVLYDAVKFVFSSAE